MPYKNIVFVKLKLELLSDYRFTEMLNDRQKLVYLCLLLVAGCTKNSTPNDPRYIKRLVNLGCKLGTLRKDIDTILKVFPKVKTNGTYIFFDNFDETHNYVLGNPKEKNRKSQNRNWDVLDKDKEVDKDKDKEKDTDTGATRQESDCKKTETDHELGKVIKYIYDTRLKKTGNKYPVSQQLAKRLKDLCRIYTHSEVCAAWAIFINDKLGVKDREFWCKGYLPERFTSQQCFAICQDHPDYKSQVRRHEKETFGEKPINIECEVKAI